MNIKRFGLLLKGTAKAWYEDKMTRLGAALAFYMMFSLAPLLLIVMGITGIIFGNSNAQTQLVGQIENLVGGAGGRPLSLFLKMPPKQKLVSAHFLGCYCY
jgi:membrane protein